MCTLLTSHQTKMTANGTILPEYIVQNRRSKNRDCRGSAVSHTPRAILVVTSTHREPIIVTASPGGCTNQLSNIAAGQKKLLGGCKDSRVASSVMCASN